MLSFPIFIPSVDTYGGTEPDHIFKDVEQATVNVEGEGCYRGWLETAGVDSNAEVQIRVEIRKWSIDNLTGPGSQVGAPVVAFEDSLTKLSGYNPHDDTWNITTNNFELYENHVYLVRLRLEVGVTTWGSSAGSDFGDFPTDYSGNGTGYSFFKVNFANAQQLRKADLFVRDEDLTITPPEPIEGVLATISIPVYNIGATDATNVTVRFTDNGQLIAEETIALVPAGEMAPVSVPWNTIGGYATNPHTIEVIVDPSNAIVEKRDDNNNASRTGVIVK